MLSRVVRIFNVCAAVAVVLIAIAIYRYAFRPLPQTSGELVAPVRAPGVIKRDARGVPHIEAASWQDAFFLQGLATAQDRLWQMDTLRRFGAGELAEVFGPAAVPADEKSRRMRMRAIADAGVAHLPPDVRTAMVEYARGVNFYIEQHRKNLPLEFEIPGREYTPRPWTPIDSVLVGLVMYRDLTDSSKLDFGRGQLAGQIAHEKFRTLFPATQGAALSPGSNAWAVSGARSAHGKPLLANDPHLAYGMPGTWVLVQLKAPGFNVAGAALPGLPCVISGHNEQIAWGVTNMHTDVMDLYAEQMDERTGRYVFKGQTEQALLDRQMIGVRGSKPVAVNVWITRHGPLFVHANGKSYTLRWSATDGFSFPFLALDRAANWNDFRSALKEFWGPGQNFVYADRAGNIGYQATGRMPIRGDGKTSVASDMPLDGASGTAEWTGYIPFEQMPTIYNPPSGLIATANQNPYPPNFPFQVPGNYADRYRVEQIRALLSAKAKWTAPEMVDVQKDVYSGYDLFLARQALRAIELCKAEDLREVANVLKGWNGQMDHGLAAPAVTELLQDQLGASLVTSLTAPAAPATDLVPRPQVIETLLRTRPRSFVAGDDWNRWLVTCLRKAVAEGRKRQGGVVSHWRWGRIMEWKVAHPIGKELPVVERFFDIGPVEMSGSPTTVKQTGATMGPSERMVVDLGSLDESVQNLLAGESGMVGSKHYKDQWDAYYSGKSFPMEFVNVRAVDTLRVVPER